MSDIPTTIAELDQFIKDQVQESLHLDYKASPAIDGSKRLEISKDVSAFANSDGGMLIYGVIESFRLGHAPALVKEGDDSLSRFDLTVSYDHPESNQRVSEVFHIDLMDFWGSYTGESEIYELGTEIKEAAKKLTDEVSKLSAHISRLTPLAGATGLDLSVSTLRNLRHIAAGNEPLEKLNPNNLSHVAFMEVLGVDFETAYRLSDFFYHGNENNGLEEIEGLTAEIIERIKKHFIVLETSTSSESV